MLDFARQTSRGLWKLSDHPILRVAKAVYDPFPGPHPRLRRVRSGPLGQKHSSRQSSGPTWGERLNLWRIESLSVTAYVFQKETSIFNRMWRQKDQKGSEGNFKEFSGSTVPAGFRDRE